MYEREIFHILKEIVQNNEKSIIKVQIFVNTLKKYVYWKIFFKKMEFKKVEKVESRRKFSMRRKFYLLVAALLSIFLFVSCGGSKEETAKKVE